MVSRWIDLPADRTSLERDSNGRLCAHWEFRQNVILISNDVLVSISTRALDNSQHFPLPYHHVKKQHFKVKFLNWAPITVWQNLLSLFIVFSFSKITPPYRTGSAVTRTLKCSPSPHLSRRTVPIATFGASIDCAVFLFIISRVFSIITSPQQKNCAHRYVWSKWRQRCVPIYY